MAEITWDGKYKDGKRVAPVRIALPFQTVETVNESAQDRLKTLDLFSSGRPTEWRNRLIWGDKKYVLPSLLAEFAGKVNLVYIDPPFDTGSDFSFTAEIPGSSASLLKEPSIIEQKAYRDTWGRGLDSYLHWFYETAVLLKDLLAENGSLYVHLDWHVGHYAKAVLDEVFGQDNCLNEIVWKRTSARSDSQTFNHIHDVIYFYGFGDYAFNETFIPHDPEYIASKYTHADKKGRRFMLDNMTSPNPRPNMMYEWKGHASPAMGWRYSKETMQRLHDEGRIWYPDSKDKRPRLIRYLDESSGQPATSIWTDISPVNSQASERLNYDTQKPEALLERILKASSKPGDLVLDCFCGSGTTATVAEKQGRRWITCDLGRFAIHTARKRLLNVTNVKPFVVQNLGKYERQAWMAAEFDHPQNRAAVEEAYRKFILDLFGAETMTGTAWLHGVKAGRLVHVGAVDAPVTLADVKAIARDAWKVSGADKEKGKSAAVDILGWEFAFELNETAKQLAAEARVDVKFRRIPREVLEKAAVEQGDVQAKDFFELRALSTKVSKSKRSVTVELTDFIIPPEDLPQDVAKTIKHWSQWVDYWAIDWDYKTDTFHNEWQAFRSKQSAKLELKAEHEYRAPGTYRVLVKVIDLLGNDTTKSLTVEVK